MINPKWLLYVSCDWSHRHNWNYIFTQYRRIDLPKELGHAVEESNTDSKKKYSVEALAHLKDYMNTMKNEPGKWQDLEYYHTSYKFWGGFSTYMGNHERNKTSVNFPWGKKTSSKKYVMSRKLTRTDTSNKYVWCDQPRKVGRPIIKNKQCIVRNLQIVIPEVDNDGALASWGFHALDASFWNTLLRTLKHPENNPTKSPPNTSFSQTNSSPNYNGSQPPPPASPWESKFRRNTQGPPPPSPEPPPPETPPYCTPPKNPPAFSPPRNEELRRKRNWE